MSYVKERMADKINAIQLNVGAVPVMYLSMKTGAILNPPYPGYVNERYNIASIKSFNSLEAAQTYARAAKKQASTQKKRNQYYKNIPDVISSNYPRTFTTGNPFKVGSQRDSALNAMNRTLAKISGIPLNTANKRIINKIYGDELRAAQGAGVAEFNQDIGRGVFSKVRNVRYGIDVGLRANDGKWADSTRTRVDRYKDIDIPGFTNLYRGDITEQEQADFLAAKRARMARAQAARPEGKKARKAREAREARARAQGAV